MRKSNMISKSVQSALVAAFLVATFAFQIRFLPVFDIDRRISLFYIPAAVITLSALTLRYAAVPGIFVGYAVINFAQNSTNPESAILLSLAPAIVTITTIVILSLTSRRMGNFLRPHSTLSEIDAFDILLFCASYGVINATLHHILFLYDADFGIPVSPMTALQMMFGDLTGSFLGFIALNLAFSIVKRIMR